MLLADTEDSLPAELMVDSAWGLQRAFSWTPVPVWSLYVLVLFPVLAAVDLLSCV